MPRTPGSPRQPSAQVTLYLTKCRLAIEAKQSPPEPPESVCAELGPERIKRAIARLQASNASKAPAPASTPPPAHDLPVIEDYTILEERGNGSFGTVFVARDERHDRGLVALKLASHRFGPGDTKRAELFFPDAKRLASIVHPNVVHYYDRGMIVNESGYQRPYIVMQYVKGTTLRKWVAPKNGPGKTLAPGDAAEMFLAIANAAEVIHEGRPQDEITGILHRDIKPANLLIDKDGKAYLADFGLDRPHGAVADGAGTPDYMAPEVALRLPEVKGRSDIYSLGVTLHFALVGGLPWPASDGSVSNSPSTETPQTRAAKLAIPIKQLPRDLDAIRLKCVKFDPGERYESAKQLAVDLAAFLAGRSVEARPVGPAMEIVMWCRRNKVAAAGALAIPFAIAIALFLWGQTANAKLEAARAKLETAQEKLAREGANRIAAMTLSRVVEIATDDNSRLTNALPIKDRRAFLEGLMPYFDQLVLTPGDDAEFRATKASAMLRRARLHRALGRKEDNAKALADLDAVKRLSTDLPKTRETEIVQAAEMISRGAIIGPMGQLGESERNLAAAVPRLEALLKTDPHDKETRYLLTKALSNLATAHLFLGIEMVQAKKDKEAAAYFEKAEIDYRDAVTHLERLLRDAPDDPRFVDWLSRVLGNFGLVQIEHAAVGGVGALDRAADSLTRSFSVAEEFVKRDPRALVALDAQATATINRAELGIASKNAAEAIEFSKSAIARYDHLYSLFPDILDFEWGQAIARLGLARAYHLQKQRPGETISALIEANRQYVHLLTRSKDNPRARAEHEELLKLMGKYLPIDAR